MTTTAKSVIARGKPAHSRLQRGMSIMELMVGLAIGLVLTLGMFTMIVSTSQSFRVNDDFSRMQENAATALRYLGDSLRQAGFYGNAQDTTSTQIPAGSLVATTSDCGSAAITPAVNFALDFATPIRAYKDYTPPSAALDFPCIRSTNFNAGPPGWTNPNPILVTRGASGFRVCWATVGAVPNISPACSSVNLLNSQPNFGTTIYVQSDPYSGMVFYGGDYAALRAGPGALKYSNGTDMEMFEYRAHVYYVRPCSRPAVAGNNCTGAADDNGHPIPTLVRQELIASAMTEVPLVEGIELIDYRFGIDTTGDGVADFYTANVVNAAQWALVVAVKVTVLVRSPNINIEYDDSGKQYDLLGDGTAIFKCASNTGVPLSPGLCNYKRKVFSQTFQVRNVAQRKGA